ncbi:uncharacterized protein LOC141907161 [Tubulanus polymorphus]|uniref:uncharacterized protein LOC141907161 n=1 Tax=Tubulanus polymorphus TaxID=672921 RepID=UPI003DA2430E
MEINLDKSQRYFSSDNCGQINEDSFDRIKRDYDARIKDFSWIKLFNLLCICYLLLPVFCTVTVSAAGCTPDPCKSGAVCTPVAGNDHTCDCLAAAGGTPDLLAGKNCDTITCGTGSAPCKNGGTCDSNTGKCTCVNSFTGTICEIHPCDNIIPYCKNNGVCTKAAAGASPAATCDCKTGFSGVDCSTADPCNKSGSCKFQVGTTTCVTDPNDNTLAKCTCKSGLSGANCDVVTCGVDNAPCNPGTCDAANKKCICNTAVTGYTGTDCSVSDPCNKSGSCKFQVGTTTCVTDPTDNTVAKCTCKPGLSGANCDVVTCGVDNAPCNPGTCDAANKKCICNTAVTGYTGTDCSVSDPCNQSGSCKFNVRTASCITDPTNNTLAKCTCKPGLSGANCDVVTCGAGINVPCMNSGTCASASNTCACVNSFSGPICEIHPCDNKIPYCKNNGVCTKAAAGASPAATCNCETGFSGANCNTEDRCISQKPCKNGNCTAGTASGAYTCQCNSGWKGKNCDQDIDECTPTNPCQNSGTCKNLLGSYKCTCAAGWKGVDCTTDIDECAQSPPICVHGTCANQPTGSYTCTCTPGFNGKNCDGLFYPAGTVQTTATGRGQCSDPIVIPGGLMLSGISGMVKMPDGSSYPDTEFPQQFYVCTSGYIGLVLNPTRPKLNSPIPKPLTAKGTQALGTSIIAPFWADMELSSPGKLYYDVYDSDLLTVTQSAQTQQQQVIARAKHDVEKYLKKQNPNGANNVFVPKQAIVVTYENICPNPSKYYKTKEQTSFQVVVTSDGERTFIVFLYQDVPNKAWNADAHWRQIQIGYNSGGVNPTIIESTVVNKLNMTQSSNINMNGIYVYDIGPTSASPNHYRLCKIWEKTGRKPTIQITAGPTSCPKTLAQAQRDPNFMVYQAETSCFKSAFTEPLNYVDGGTNKNTPIYVRCCYSTDRELQNYPVGTSNFDATSQMLFTLSAVINTTTDGKAYSDCYAANIQKLYFKYRPMPTSTGYTSPKKAIMFGDPHIVNLGGTLFTMNGYGEYWLINLNTIKLQGRTAPAPAATNFKPQATIFTAFSFQTVEPTATETIEVLLKNGVELVLNLKYANGTIENIPWSSARLTPVGIVKTDYIISKPTANTLLVVFKNKFTVQITLDSALKVMKCEVTVPASVVASVKGLLSSTLQPPTGNALPNTDSEQNIYTNLVKPWAITQAESLFNYPQGQTSANYKDATYVPLYSDTYDTTNTSTLFAQNNALMNTANQTCLDKNMPSKYYKKCMFDAARMQNAAAATYFVSVAKTFENDLLHFRNPPPAITLQPVPTVCNWDQLCTVTATVSGGKAPLTGFVSQDKQYTGTKSALVLSQKSFTYKPIDTVPIIMTMGVKDSVNTTTTVPVNMRLCQCRKVNAQDTPCKFTYLDNDAVFDKHIGFTAPYPDSFNLALCKCGAKLAGRDCQLSYCQTNPCYPGVTCDSNTNKCGNCPKGMTGDGVMCYDIDECLEQKILSGNANPNADKCDAATTTCINQLGTYKCICKTAGYQIDQTNHLQCVDINECSNPLLNNCNATKNEKCSNTAGSFTCDCKTGFLKNLTTKACDDINECQPANQANAPCNAKATCANTPGSYNCTCPSGYTGDGKKTPGSGCTDIDECKIPGMNNCEQICTNTPGTYQCSCNPGFTANKNLCQAQAAAKCAATNKCLHYCSKVSGVDTCYCNKGFKADPSNSSNCIDINECSTNNGGCKDQAHCQNFPGGYNCSCPAGQQLLADKISCQLINECLEKTDNCSVNATCTDKAVGFTCQCKAGYTGDGYTCKDTNECASSTTNNCGTLAQCYNTPGSFYCVCPAGLTGKPTVSCSIPGQTYRVTIKLLRPYSAALQNKGSAEYAQAVKDVQSVCAGIYKSYTSFSGCTVLSFSSSAGARRKRNTAGTIPTTNANTLANFQTDPNVNLNTVNAAGKNYATKNPQGGCVSSNVPVVCAPAAAQPFNECTASHTFHNCLLSTKCVDTPDSYKCVCNSGFRMLGTTGKSEDCIDINECETTCKNIPLVNCTNTPGSFICACDTGYYSANPMNETCQKSCKPDTCEHEGVCEYRSTKPGYFCRCPHHYIGERCETIDPKYDEMRTTAICLGVIFGLLFLIVLIILLIYCFRRRTSKERTLWTVEDDARHTPQYVGYEKRGSMGSQRRSNAHSQMSNKEVTLETWEPGYIPRAHANNGGRNDMEMTENSRHSNQNNDQRTTNFRKSADSGIDNPTFQNPTA